MASGGTRPASTRRSRSKAKGSKPCRLPRSISSSQSMSWPRRDSSPAAPSKRQWAQRSRPCLASSLDWSMMNGLAASPISSRGIRRATARALSLTLPGHAPPIGQGQICQTRPASRSGFLRPGTAHPIRWGRLRVSWRRSASPSSTRIYRRAETRGITDPSTWTSNRTRCTRSGSQACGRS